MSTQTTKLSLSKPAQGDMDWTAEINGNWDILDDALVVAGDISSKNGNVLTVVGGDPAFTDKVYVDTTNGRLGIGTTSPLVQLHLSSSASDAIYVDRVSGDAGSAEFRLRKARGAVGTEAIVQDGDAVGTFDFHAFDGVDYNGSAASITVEIDGTPGENDVPGKIIFATTADGSDSPTERVIIDSAGNVVIPADDAKLVFGAGQDAELYYDGTDLVVNPKAVGSGALKVTGDLKGDGSGVVSGFADVRVPASEPTGAIGSVYFDDTTDRLYVKTTDGWKYASLT